MKNDVIETINMSMNSFSKGQKAIAEFILTNYDRAAFITARGLGEEVGVSESTVVRFAVTLGFDGYPDLQGELQELIRNKLTAVQRIKVSETYFKSDNILNKVLDMDAECIKTTMRETSPQEFEKAVEATSNAKNIYIIGGRSAAALSRFLHFYMNIIFENVKLVHTTSSSEMFEQIMRLKKGDVLIGISFPRYSKMTIKAFEFAKDCGADVIAITDSETSPIAKAATIKLLARSGMLSFIDSLAAPLSLINAFLVAVSTRKNTDVISSLSKLENIWEEYDVYEKTKGKLTE